MKFMVLTIFPEMFRSFQEHGMIRRAIENGLISLDPIDVRDFAAGRHRVTDDGGASIAVDSAGCAYGSTYRI